MQHCIMGHDSFWQCEQSIATLDLVQPFLSYVYMPVGLLLLTPKPVQAMLS